MSESNKTAKKRLGDLGESLAQKAYEKRGYELVDRNVQIPRVGEIDVILQRQLIGKTEFVFVEVKTRSNSYSGFGYESVNYEKRTRMRKCAMAWIGGNIDHRKVKISYRIDVVSIDMSTNPPTLSIFENIEV